jgi:ribonuclease VapC
VSGSGKPVMDAAAVLALVQDEPGAERLWPLCPRAVVSAVNVGEVLAKLIARGMPPKTAQAAFDALHLAVVPFEAGDAALSAAYVARGVSLGDRCFLACAQRHGTGWTADHDLAGIEGASLPPLEMFR